MKKSIKKFFCGFLTVIMLLSVVPMTNNLLDFSINASAEGLASTGQCGKNVFWAFDSGSGLLTISGTGAMYNKNISSHGDSQFKENTAIQKVFIENGITSIGPFAFYGCISLVEVHMPDTVIEIDEGAFMACSSLSKINFSKNLREIPLQCFKDCSSLYNVEIPEGVTKIKQYAFVNCKSINNLIIPKSIKNISESFNGAKINNLHYMGDFSDWCKISFGEYYGCPNAFATNVYFDNGNPTAIIIPDGVTVLQSYMFMNIPFENMERMVIPESVETIEVNAFGNFKFTGTVYFEGTVEQWCCIEMIDSPCNKSTGLYIGGEPVTDIVIPDTVSKIYGSAFKNCKTLKSVIFEGDLIEIGNNAFGGCVNLVDVSFQGSVSKIQHDAFRACRSIESLVLPDGIVSVSSCAFTYLVSLKEILIPDSILSIYSNTFDGTDGIEKVYYTGTEEQWNAVSGHEYLDNKKSAVFYYNFGKKTGTCGDNLTWSYNTTNGKLIVDGAGNMDDCAFFYDYGWYSFKNDISYVEVSDGITNIGTNAFAGCTGVKEVYLGEDITVVGENAFADCTNLSIVSVTSDKFTAEDAFKNNNSKLTFVISKGNNDAENFAKNNGYSVITASYSADEHTIEFKGNTIVYKGLQYNYLTNFVNEYSNAEYLHFDRLEFDGVKPDVIIIEDCENIASDVKNFALNDLYVSLKVIIGGHEEQITFEKMFELLESGNYDAFKLKFRSESGETEETFFEKIAEFFEEIYTSALRVITKAINFVVGIFKKK